MDPTPSQDPSDAASSVVLLSELIGMPLAAITRSDSEAARALLRFILEFGFGKPPPDSPPGTLGPLLTVSFDYDTVDSQGVPLTRQLTIPLLSLIPLPALSIREATLEFGIEVVGMLDRTKGVNDSDPSNSNLLAKEPDRELKVRVARDRSSRTPGNSSSTRSDIQVNITMESSDLPVGLIQLLNRLPESIISRPTDRLEPVLRVYSLSGQIASGDLPMRPGSAVELVFRLVDRNGNGIPDQIINLQEAQPGTFYMPERSLITDRSGEKRTIVGLRTPPAGPTQAALIATATVQPFGEPAMQLVSHLNIEIQP